MPSATDVEEMMGLMIWVRRFHLVSTACMAFQAANVLLFWYVLTHGEPWWPIILGQVGLMWGSSAAGNRQYRLARLLTNIAHGERV